MEETTIRWFLELLKDPEKRPDIEVCKNIIARSMDTIVKFDIFYEIPNDEFFDIIERADVKDEEHTFTVLIQKACHLKWNDFSYLPDFLNFEKLKKEETIKLLKNFEKIPPKMFSSEFHLLERDYEPEIRKLKEDNETFRNENKKLKEENKEYEENNEKLNEENKKLKENNETLKEENKEYEENNETLKEENKKLKEDNEKLKKELDDLKAHEAECSIKKPGNFEPDLRTAIELKKYDSARYIIEGKESNGSTLLHYATKYFYFPCIDYVMKNKLTDINAKDSYGQTPLHIAASCGYLHIVEYFVNECKADIEAKDDKGRTPLFVAVSMKQFGITKYLIEECHANIEVENNYGCSLVNSAATSGSLEILKYLIGHGLSAQSRDKYNAAPIFNAANMGHLEIVEYLFKECKVKIPNYIKATNVTDDCYKYLKIRNKNI